MAAILTTARVIDTVSTGHPRQQVLFFVSKDVNRGLRKQIKDLVQHLGSARNWVLGPPRFVNRREKSGTVDVETLGGCLEIYSGMPVGSLPRELDRAHLEEVSTIVEGLREFSRKRGVAFDLEIDGTYVGSIQDGNPNRSLSEGLLGEWRRHLADA